METTIETSLNKEKLYTLKIELKKTAKTIRELKSHKKLKNRDNWSIYDLNFKIQALSHQFRHKHITSCLVRGKTYEQIEPTVRKGNEPNWNLIRSVADELTE